MDLVAGVDFGGTSAKIGLVDRAGGVHARDRVAIDARAGHEAILGPVIDGLRRLAAARPRPDRVVGVGVGTPGFIDRDSGTIAGGCENIPSLLGRSPGGILGAALGVPAWADNDATCAAAAELAYGAGRGLQSFIVVTVGTGIGGGLVLGGKVWRGARGFAGEIGHISLDPGGPWCPCGGRGCLEQYASGPAIFRAWQDMAGRRGVSTPARSPVDVAELARAADPLALAAFAGAGRALAQALGGVINLLNIEACIIGGGVAGAGEILLGPLRRSLPDHAFALAAAGVPVVAAGLGNEAGLLGAAALAWERLGS